MTVSRFFSWLLVFLLLGGFVAAAVLALRARAAAGKGLPAFSVYSTERDGLAESARLLEKLSGLPDVVHMGDYRPTDAAEEAFGDMTSRIDAVIADFDKLVEGKLADLNTAAAAASMPAMLV